MNKIIAFLRGVYREMRKVVWPTKKETTNYMLIVFVFSVATAIFLGGFDFLFSQLMKLIII